METWGWIIVYLVGFALFQLLLLRYFADGRTFSGASLGSSEASSPGSVDPGQHAPEVTGDAQQDGRDEDGGVHCPQCGAYNADEQTFTYCQKCLTQLR
jgi:hypothetical protein